MNPLHIQASNCRTYTDLAVTFPTGCTAIIGANGAGKSTILNAIDVALFADRGELPALLASGADELTLELEFEHSGEIYRVRRGYSARGRGKTTLDLERFDDQDWAPLTRENTGQTQELIEQIVGLSRTTFRASSFLAQGDGAAFTDASPRDRKAILGEILGLDLWERLQQRARVELRGCEDALVMAETRISGAAELAARRPYVDQEIARCRTDIADLDQQMQVAGEQLEEAQRELSAAAVIAARVRELAVTYQAASRAHHDAQTQLQQADQAVQELADRRVELEELAADADRIPQLEQQIAALRAQAAAADAARSRRTHLEAEQAHRETARDRLVAQSLQLHADATAARSKADHLDNHIADAGSCDRCGQTLGAEAAARAAASYRDEAAGLDQRAAEIDTQTEADLEAIAGLREQAAAIVVPDGPDLAPAELELRAARAAGERRATVEERIRHLTDVAARKPHLEEQLARAATAAAAAAADLEKAQAGAVDDATLIEKVEQARSTRNRHRRLLDDARAGLARAQAELDQVDAAEQTLAEHRDEMQMTQARIALLKLADRAYGRDGIPALILESSAIPTIEVEANRILGELGTTYRVELRTQQANKTNGNLRETLEIVVYDGSYARPYETFSGGEKTRINLALRIALASLLAGRRGAASRILAIDEPDGLDAAGMDALVQVLRNLAGTFDKTLVVSHQPQLATSFDQTIAVERRDGVSRVQGAREEALV